MPRWARRTGRRLKQDEWAVLGTQIGWFLYAVDDRDVDVIERIFGSWDAAREAWEEHGLRLTAEHVAENPGSRPWGWWAFAKHPEIEGYSGPGPSPADSSNRVTVPFSSEEERRLLGSWGMLTKTEREKLARYDEFVSAPHGSRNLEDDDNGEF